MTTKTKSLYEIATIIGIGMIGSIIYDKWIKPLLVNKGVLPLTSTGIRYSQYPSYGGLNT